MILVPSLGSQVSIERNGAAVDAQPNQSSCVLTLSQDVRNRFRCTYERNRYTWYIRARPGAPGICTSTCMTCLPGGLLFLVRSPVYHEHFRRAQNNAKSNNNMSSWHTIPGILFKFKSEARVAFVSYNDTVAVMMGLARKRLGHTSGGYFEQMAG